MIQNLFLQKMIQENYSRRDYTKEKVIEIIEADKSV